MRFLIEKNKPYLCANGRIYPVDIRGDKVTVDFEQSFLSDEIGRYSLNEVHAKLGHSASSIRRRKTKQQEV